MNLVFGQLIDDLASPSGSVLDTTSSMIKLMGVLAVVFAILAFVGMSFIPYGAARITNRVREEYVKSVLRQDMAFFDEAKPGGIVASLSGYTLDFEEGISIKLGEGIQSSWCV
jgi:ATP-binding cassette subfamily B (MDR/TAP) protein 1